LPSGFQSSHQCLQKISRFYILQSLLNLFVLSKKSRIAGKNGSCLVGSIIFLSGGGWGRVYFIKIFDCFFNLLKIVYLVWWFFLNLTFILSHYFQVILGAVIKISLWLVSLLVKFKAENKFVGFNFVRHTLPFSPRKSWLVMS